MKQSTLAIVLVVLIVPLIALAFHVQGNKTANPTPSPTPKASATATNTPTVNKASDLVDPADAKTADQVVLHTTKGDITINLFKADAPKTVENFVTLGAVRNYYNGVYFHRILADFVIQAGDPTGTGSGGASIFGAKFPDELNSHKYSVGTIGMANAGPNTNGSQFFIVTSTVADASLNALNTGGYTVFGQIDPASQAVVQAIAGVKVNDPSTGTPITPADVTITGMTIVK
jgi:cyclophilin family peptidyl-prolyl cis-trans isomerase